MKKIEFEFGFLIADLLLKGQKFLFNIKTRSIKCPIAFLNHFYLGPFTYEVQGGGGGNKVRKK